jgi:hypothetical protein
MSSPDTVSEQTKRRGLGRGFEVLLGGAGDPQLISVPLELVHPSPRQARATPSTVGNMPGPIRRSEPRS